MIGYSLQVHAIQRHMCIFFNLQNSKYNKKRYSHTNITLVTPTYSMYLILKHCLQFILRISLFFIFHILTISFAICINDRVVETFMGHFSSH